MKPLFAKLVRIIKRVGWQEKTYRIPIQNTPLTPNFFFLDRFRFQIALWARPRGISSSTRLVMDDATANPGTLKRQYALGINGFQLDSKGVQLARSMMKRTNENAQIVAADAYHSQVR